MATSRNDSDRHEANRQAVEAIVEDLAGRDLLDVADGPLVEVARTLASAVDNDPGSSQLALQYRQAVEQLRTEVQKVEESSIRDLMFSLHTGCDQHASLNLIHCQTCCHQRNGWDEVANWESIHLRGDELEIGRRAIYLFLQR